VQIRDPPFLRIESQADQAKKPKNSHTVTLSTSLFTDYRKPEQEFARRRWINIFAFANKLGVLR
jgi:hypothetical protein